MSFDLGLLELGLLGGTAATSYEESRRRGSQTQSQAKSLTQQLKSLRQNRVLRDETDMTARARRRAIAQGRTSTRHTWTTPTGEMKTIMGG